MNIAIKYMVVAVLGLATTAAADLELSWTGLAFVSEKQKVGGMWQVTVRTVGSPSMTFRVEADGTEEKIRYIRVQAERELPLTFGNCNLIVRGINGGKIVRIEEISWVPALAPADLWVGALTIEKDSSGGEGGLGTGSGGSVDAHWLGAIDVEGDVTADLTILPGSTSGASA